jgi:hypothetical protein
VTCKAADALTDLSLDEDRAADARLLAGLLVGGTDDRGRVVSAVVLARALTTLGYPVGPTTVKDHRGGRCAC